MITAVTPGRSRVPVRALCVREPCHVSDQHQNALLRWSALAFALAVALVLAVAPCSCSCRCCRLPCCCLPCPCPSRRPDRQVHCSRPGSPRSLPRSSGPRRRAREDRAKTRTSLPVRGPNQAGTPLLSGHHTAGTDRLRSGLSRSIRAATARSLVQRLVPYRARLRPGAGRRLPLCGLPVPVGPVARTVFPAFGQ